MPACARYLRLGVTPLIPALLTLTAGCQPEPRNVGGAGASTTPAAQTSAPAAPAPKSDDGFIVGKRTQDIRNAQPELQKGAQVATQKITAKDPITLQGNAYVTAIGRTSIDQIDYAQRLYQAETGEYPKTYDEFMEKIIKANNIALPQLPYYQKYAYDANTHKLMVLEYPDLKAQPPR